MPATSIEINQQPLAVSREIALPIIALGSGITVAAVLRILHNVAIVTYASCPRSDFVQSSRWCQSLPNSVNLRPDNFQSILEVLPLPKAVLLPCSDDWLRAVADLPADLAERFPSSVAGPSVEKIIDKFRFSQLLDSLRIPHPHTCVIESIDQLEEIKNIEGAILKPLSSVEFSTRYGVKGYIVESREQALQFLQKLDLPILIQEFVPGPPETGYFLDGFRDRTGHIRALFARRRMRMYPPKISAVPRPIHVRMRRYCFQGARSSLRTTSSYFL